MNASCKNSFEVGCPSATVAELLDFGLTEILLESDNVTKIEGLLRQSSKKAHKERRITLATIGPEKESWKHK